MALSKSPWEQLERPIARWSVQSCGSRMWSCPAPVFPAAAVSHCSSRRSSPEIKSFLTRLKVNVGFFLQNSTTLLKTTRGSKPHKHHNYMSNNCCKPADYRTTDTQRHICRALKAASHKMLSCFSIFHGRNTPLLISREYFFKNLWVFSGLTTTPHIFNCLVLQQRSRVWRALCYHLWSSWGSTPVSGMYRIWSALLINLTGHSHCSHCCTKTIKHTQREPLTDLTRWQAVCTHA